MSVKKNRPRSLGMALVVGVILCLLGPATAAPAEKKGKGGVKPAVAWVNNDSYYKVRGDGEDSTTVYMDASIEGDCVSVLADDPGSRRGFFQLRTVKNLDECNQDPERFLLLDFGGGEVYDVDQDENTDDQLESVYARFILEQAFSRDAEANGTSVVILILETSYDVDGPHTTQETAWELRYSSNAQVNVDESDPNIRTITSQLGSSSADLCQIQLQQRGKKFKKVCEPCGSFDMPFEVRVTRQSD